MIVASLVSSQRYTSFHLLRCYSAKIPSWWERVLKQITSLGQSFVHLICLIVCGIHIMPYPDLALCEVWAACYSSSVLFKIILGWAYCTSHFKYTFQPNSVGDVSPSSPTLPGPELIRSKHNVHQENGNTVSAINTIQHNMSGVRTKRTSQSKVTLNCVPSDIWSSKIIQEKKITRYLRKKAGCPPWERIPKLQVEENWCPKHKYHKLMSEPKVKMKAKLKTFLIWKECCSVCSKTFNLHSVRRPRLLLKWKSAKP